MIQTWNFRPYLVIAETICKNILAGTYAQGKVPFERALLPVQRLARFGHKGPRDA